MLLFPPFGWRALGVHRHPLVLQLQANASRQVAFCEDPVRSRAQAAQVAANSRIQRASSSGLFDAEYRLFFGPATILMLTRGLEASLEVLIEVAVDNGVDAGIGEGQPVREREYVAGQELQIVLVWTGVIGQQHERPQRQPGQHEEQSHHNQHLYHSDLSLRRGTFAVRGNIGLLGAGQDGGGVQLCADPAVHENDEHQGNDVYVYEQDGGVHFPHLRVGPGLVAGVQRVCAVVTVNHEMPFFLIDGQH